MNARAEGEMSVGVSLEIKRFRFLVRLRVHVGGCDHCHDLVSLLQPDAAELYVFAHKARLRELHRRDEA